MASASKTGAEKLRLGFLTAVEIGESSFVGGLLVTDRFGRPLEFQCTTPVKPNRTQELLYGPTLVPFILGELLGKALMDRISVKPSLLLTSRQEMLTLRTKITAPVVFDEASSRGAEERASRASTASATAGADGAKPGESVPEQQLIRIGQQSFRMHADFTSDRAEIEQITQLLSEEADMHEPLKRVEQALRETMSTVSARPRVA